MKKAIIQIKGKPLFVRADNVCSVDIPLEDWIAYNSKELFFFEIIMSNGQIHRVCYDTKEERNEVFNNFVKELSNNGNK